MSTQQEQAVVQAVTDTYVAAHPSALLSEIDVIHQYHLEPHPYCFPWYAQWLCANPS